MSDEQDVDRANTFARDMANDPDLEIAGEGSDFHRRLLEMMTAARSDERSALSKMIYRHGDHGDFYCVACDARKDELSGGIPQPCASNCPLERVTRVEGVGLSGADRDDALEACVFQLDDVCKWLAATGQKDAADALHEHRNQFLLAPRLHSSAEPVGGPKITPVWLEGFESLIAAWREAENGSEAQLRVERSMLKMFPLEAPEPVYGGWRIAKTSCQCNREVDGHGWAVLFENRMVRCLGCLRDGMDAATPLKSTDAIDVDGLPLSVGDLVEVVHSGAAQRIGLRAKIDSIRTGWIDLRWGEHPSGGASCWLTPPRFVRRVTAAASNPKRDDSKRIDYRCSRCGAVEASGERPHPATGRLRIYPLPPGWVLASCSDLKEDDHLHCAACAKGERP